MEGFNAVLSAEELRAVIAHNPRTRLLDVRTPGEYETVHIAGTYNVPLDSLPEHADEIRAEVEDPVVLICQSGMRARRAEEALAKAGMPNLFVLDGGVNGWVGTGNPVVRGAKRISLERQVRIVAGTLAVVGGALAVALSPLFGLVAAGVGTGLVFAGVTDRCGIAMVLTRLPYNRPASCDVGEMVRALSAGRPHQSAGAPMASAGSCCAQG
ncbi:MAG TPA: rhodanese-like domain-containing protein [Longimicrobiaceae bacterium]|nr:rhodanese-like domain-containing protein [Longimicrobiaceae bacterium]